MSNPLIQNDTETDQQFGHAVFLAAIGGLFWAIGVLGKRYGVEGAAGNSLGIWAAAMSIPYACGGCVAAMTIFLFQNAAPHRELLRDPEWRGRLSGMVLAGLLAGIGTQLSFYALAISKRSGSSALVAMAMNGVNTAGSPLALALVFGELITPRQAVAMALIMFGILTMEPWITRFFFEIHNRTARQGGDSDSRARSRADQEDAQENRPLVAKDEGNSAEAIRFGVVAGLCWCIGAVGARYGAPATASPELKLSYASLTALVYLCSSFIPFTAVIAYAQATKTDASARPSAIAVDMAFYARAMLVFCAGAIDGIGGVLCIYALGLAAHESAVINTVSLGIYSVGAALGIALIYNEKPTSVQICGLMLVTMGILMMS